MNHSTRIMTNDDIVAVVAIIRAHDAFDGQRSQWYFNEYFGDKQRMHSDDQQNHVVVHRETGAVVGVCGFSPDKYKTPNIFWLNWLYIDSGYQRQGLGGMLLEHALHCLRSRNCRKLYLDTSSDPKYQPAMDFYAKAGFDVEGRLKDYYDPGEDYLILGKVL